jgi:hypothetical protein
MVGVVQGRRRWGGDWRRPEPSDGDKAYAFTPVYGHRIKFSHEPFAFPRLVSRS